jgi:hypothetical protein
MDVSGEVESGEVEEARAVERYPSSMRGNCQPRHCSYGFLDLKSFFDSLF